MVGWIATQLLVGPLRRLLGRSHLDVSVVSFLVNTVRTVILLAVLLTALHNRLRAESRIFKEPPPRIYVQEWTADKQTLAVTAWTATADYLEVQRQMLEELGKSVEAARTPSHNH